MRHVTIKDVAQRAGVSITTTSFALNNVKGRVSEEIRQHVLKCAEELNYSANTNARILRTSVCNTFMLVYGEMFLFERNASTMLAINGMMEYANQYGKEILINLISAHTAYEEELDKYKKIWASRRVDGMIFQCHFEDERDETFYTDLYKSGINLVNISRLGRPANHPSVYLNEYSVTKSQVEFVKRKGYTDVYYLCKRSNASGPRNQGYQEAVREMGLNGDSLFYEQYSRTKQDLWQLLEPITKKKRRFAVICWNDVDAINVIELLQAKGLRVPYDVGVMGYDDIPIAEHVTPRLTTVSQPHDKMAYIACEMLKKNQNKKYTKSPKSIEVAGEIIDRQSL